MTVENEEQSQPRPNVPDIQGKSAREIRTLIEAANETPDQGTSVDEGTQTPKPEEPQKEIPQPPAQASQQEDPELGSLKGAFGDEFISNIKDLPEDRRQAVVKRLKDFEKDYHKDKQWKAKYETMIRNFEERPAETAEALYNFYKAQKQPVNGTAQPQTSENDPLSKIDPESKAILDAYIERRLTEYTKQNVAPIAQIVMSGREQTEMEKLEAQFGKETVSKYEEQILSRKRDPYSPVTLHEAAKLVIPMEEQLNRGTNPVSQRVQERIQAAVETPRGSASGTPANIGKDASLDQLRKAIGVFDRDT